MTSFRDFLPFSDARPRKTAGKQASAVLVDPGQVKKVYKISSIAQGFSGGSAGSSRANFETAPYNFDRIIQAIDTDSYVKQGFNKYKELIWKEGWVLIGENTDAVDYLHQRFDIMEFTMKRPFQDLLVEISDQLCKMANAFVAKARGDVAAYSSIPLTPVGKSKDPISGFYVVPTETMKISRDANNTILGYQQDVSSGGGSGKGPPEWSPEDMIHFAIDKKPGRVFGTPFLVTVMDDVIALRQIEEDIQNLVHRELFPLYIYQVGTPEDPSDPDEIIAAGNELSNLRTEGGLIIPERHEVSVLGAEGNAMDANEYLRYFQERVVVGLGLAPHHLGIMNAGGNRSVTDRLDIALYDKIKNYQRYIAETIRLSIINELLMEGGFDPLMFPEDRVRFRFNEIDVDTRVKKDAATLQKWAANAIDLPETRMKLGEDPEVDEAQLLIALTTRMAPDTVTSQKSATGNVTPTTVDTTPAAAAKSDAAKPSTGGTANQPNKAARTAGNAVRPQNQHGRRMSPNIRHSVPMDEEWLSDVVNLLD